MLNYIKLIFTDGIANRKCISRARQEVPTEPSLQIQVTPGLLKVHEKLHGVHEKYRLIAIKLQDFLSTKI